MNVLELGRSAASRDDSDAPVTELGEAHASAAIVEQAPLRLLEDAQRYCALDSARHIRLANLRQEGPAPRLTHFRGSAAGSAVADMLQKSRAG